jgi:hypothetical protein
MASTYTANQGIEKMDTGDQSGTWGGTVNTNMDIIDRAISGVGALTLTGSTTTLTTTDGTLTDGMYRVLVLGDGGDLGSDNTLTISPNDQDKAYLVYNNLSANRNAIFSQGTGANATVQNGETAWIYADGAGSGAAVRTAVSSVKITDQDGDTQIQVEEGGDDDDTIRFDLAGAEDFTMTANTFNVLSGSTLNINSGATIANNGTATGFGGSATSAKTAAYTVIAADDGKTILCSAASADYEVALTAAGTLGDGFSVTLKKSDATKFMITINPNGSETIDGLPDLKLRNEHSEVTLICDGSNWHIISHENVAYEYNAIDNSNFQVDQYSQSVTRTALGSGSTLRVQDRWKVAMSNVASVRFTYSVETGGGVDGRQKWSKLLCTTADASPNSNELLQWRHNITGNNLVGAGFLGTDKFVENMIISFDMLVHIDGASSVTFPAKMGVNCFTGDSTSREYVNDVSVAANDTWERVSIVIPQDTAANWSAGTSSTLYFNFTPFAGSGSVGTANAWVNTGYTNYITSASDNFGDATNNYVGITNVKLQPGQIATPYIPRTYEEELTVCKFYAELLTYQTAGSQIIAFGTASGTGAGQVNVTYQEKRAAPAVTGSAAGTFQLSDYNGGGTNDATGVSWNEPGLTNVRMSVSYGGSAFTVNDAIRVNRDGSDAAYIFIDAGI